MSFTIIVVEKTGALKELALKSFDEAELYKKAGFKTADGFKCHTQWVVDKLNHKSYSICVYGKTSGRANQENKFEFPPPIDNTLFFGNCLIVNKAASSVAPLSVLEWNSIYEHLYGGFEDIGAEDSDEEDDEEDEDDDLPRTKSGYVKDGFIVDDDAVDDDDNDDEEEEDDDEEEEEDEESAEEEEKVVTKSKSRSAPKTPSKAPVVKKTRAPRQSKAKAQVKPQTVFNAPASSDDNYLECASELSEESYV